MNDNIEKTNEGRKNLIQRHNGEKNERATVGRDIKTARIILLQNPI
jgi:hypothetical protein